MSLLLYTTYALSHLCLLLWGVIIWRRFRFLSTLLFAAILFGLFYDNLILALGNSIGPGEMLRALSVPRFVLHQLILPWLILGAAQQLARADRRHAPGPQLWAVGLSALVMAAGIATRVAVLSLEAEVMDGVNRYVAVGTIGPPIVSIISVGFAGVTGFLLWRRHQWPWVFVTVVLAFIAEGIPVEAIRRVFGSGFEVLLMAALIETDRRLGIGLLPARAPAGAEDVPTRG
jgi:hypothetical protein